MEQIHEKLFRAATALSVAVIEDINGAISSRGIITAMREAQNQISAGISELAQLHALKRRKGE